MSKLKTFFSKYRVINLSVSLFSGFCFYLDILSILNHDSSSFLMIIIHGLIISICFCTSLFYFIGFCANIRPAYVFNILENGLSEKQEKIPSTQLNDTHAEDKEEQSLSLTSKSSFDELKVSLKAIFINYIDIIKNLDKLILAKNQMLEILNQNDNNVHTIEFKLFLEKDFEQMIDSLKDEAKLLSQMKSNHHPQLEEQKKEFLESMVERMSLIGQKMLDENDIINNNMQDTLKEKRQVSLAFLKSKM
jgi:hypothetical protein